MSTREILIYALPRGETERYAESLLSTQCRTDGDIESLKERAAKDGWHSFRLTTYDGSAPNFAATVRRRR